MQSRPLEIIVRSRCSIKDNALLVTVSRDGDRSWHDTSSGYFLPNDSTERQRLDDQSDALIQMMHGRPFMTPIDELARATPSFKAADLGSGTGVMTRFLANVIQRAQQSPTSISAIYGVDLSPNIPPGISSPSNVSYIQADIMSLPKSDHRFHPATFDFLTHRLLVFGIPDWALYLKNCFSLLKPGTGLVEIQDISLRWFDPSGEEISANWKWLAVLKKSLLKFGIDIVAAEKLKALMTETGLVDVEERVYKWTYSDVLWEEYPDSEAIGKYSQNTAIGFFEKMLGKAARNAGFEGPEDLEGLGGVEELEEDYKKTLPKVGKGAHINYRVVCGRRP